MGTNATGSRPRPHAGRRRLAVAAVTAATALSLLTASGAAHGLADHQSEAATVRGGAVASEHAGFTGSGYVDYDDENFDPLFDRDYYSASFSVTF